MSVAVFQDQLQHRNTNCHYIPNYTASHCSRPNTCCNIPFVQSCTFCLLLHDAGVEGKGKGMFDTAQIQLLQQDTLMSYQRGGSCRQLLWDAVLFVITVAWKQEKQSPLFPLTTSCLCCFSLKVAYVHHHSEPDFYNACSSFCGAHNNPFFHPLIPQSAHIQGC